MSSINLVVGDTRPVITFTLRDRNTAAAGAILRPNDPETWAPITLTGATVRLYMRRAGATEVKNELNCVVTDPANGKVALTFPPGALDEAGTFEGEIEITFADEGVLTIYEFVKFKVRDEIA